MKKVLFLDRDGTLVIEPPSDKQLDSFSKLKFFPKVLQFLPKIIQDNDYEVVMVTNQDGLGTESFPEHTFWPIQNLIIQVFKNAGVTFSEVLIDPSLPEDNSPNRKPGIGLFNKYIEGNYDLANSVVIGDRLSDMQLAKNLGAKGILIGAGMMLESPLDPEEEDALDDTILMTTNDWWLVYDLLQKRPRFSTVERNTQETEIRATLSLDYTTETFASTGLGFFDHMIEQIGKHSQTALTLHATGDLKVDEHHTIEDSALVLGELYAKALGDKMGIERYGFSLPMDDCQATCLLDFGGRPWLVWEADFKREKIGEMPTEMFMHFFKSFSDAAKCNIYIKADGKNEHHKIEAIFKSFARAIKMAIRREGFAYDLPTTKGTI